MNRNARLYLVLSLVFILSLGILAITNAPTSALSALPAGTGVAVTSVSVLAGNGTAKAPMGTMAPTAARTPGRGPQPLSGTPDHATLVAVPTSINNDGTTSTLTFTVFDNTNAPLSGIPVTLTITNPSPLSSFPGLVVTPMGGATLNGNTVTGNTNGSGALVVTISSTRAANSPSSVTAFAFVNQNSNINGNVTVNITQSPATSGTVSTNKSTAIGDGTDAATITVVYTDSQGHAVPNRHVTVTMNQPVYINGSASATTTYSSTTDATGTVSFTAAFINSTTSPVSVTFTPVDTDDGNLATTPVSVTVSYTPPQPDAGQSSLVVTVPNGATYDVNHIPADNQPNDKAIVTVTLKDRNGHLLSGRTVSLGTSGVTVNVAPSSASTVNGVATFNVTATYPNTGTVTFTANVAGTSFINGAAPTGQATFVLPAASATLSTVSPATATIPADNTTTQVITVTVLDANSDPLGGQNVTLGADKSAGISGLGTATTNSSGVATFTVKSSVRTAPSDVVTFTATVNQSSGTVVITQTSQITFTASLPDPIKSTIASLPPSGSVVGDDLATITLRVTLEDKGGQPIAGKSVGINVSGVPGGATVSPVPPSNPANGQTNAQGVIDFMYKGNAANGQFTAQFTGMDTTDNVTVTPNPLPITFTVPNASGSNSTIVVSTIVAGAEKTSVQANGVDSTTVQVTVKDAGGDVMPNKSVVLNASATAGDNLNGIVVNGQPLTSGVSVAVLTNASGQATFTIQSNVAHTPGITWTATVDSQTISVGPANPPTSPQTNVPVVIYFTNAAPDTGNSTVSVSPASPPGVPADGVTAIQVTVTLKDISGNVLNGRVVRLRTASTPGGTPQPGVMLTPNAGDATIGLTSTNSGGQAVFSVTSTVAYPSGVQFYIDDLTDGVNNFQPTNNYAGVKLLDFTASASNVVDPTKSGIEVFPNALNANQHATITVTLRDSNNLPIVGKPIGSVVLYADPFPNTPLPNGVVITTISTVSDASGKLTYDITSSLAATVTLDAFADSTSLINHVAPGSTGSRTITFTGSTATPTSTYTPTSTATSSVASNTPTATSSVPSNTPTATSSVPSNTPTSTSSVPSNTPTATALNNVPSAVTSTINVSPTFVPANGTSIATILVIVRNSSGTPLGGQTVTLIPSPNPVPSGVNLSATTGTTASDGSVAFSVSSSVATTVSFTASAGGVTISQTPLFGSNSVTFTVPPNPNTISGSLSSISPSSASVPADGNSGVTISVTVRTINNQAPTVTTSVTLYQSGSGVFTRGATTVTVDSNGNASFTVYSSTVETTTMTAVAQNQYGSVQINGGTTITFTTPSSVTSTPSSSSTAPSASTSTLTTDYVQIPADNATIATLTATLKTSGGSVISGKTIQINQSQTLSGVTVTALNAVTDGNGQAKFTVKSSVQGTITFSAVDTSDSPQVYITQTQTIVFAAAGTAAVAATSTSGTTSPSTAPTGPVVGVVLAYRLNVRTGPGLTFDILGLLAYRTRILVLARNARGNWLNIQLRDRTAWVYRGLVRLARGDFARLAIIGDETGDGGGIPAPPGLIPLTGTGTGVVVVGPIHTRSGPGLNYSQRGDLTYGTEVTILGRSEDRLWYEIQVQGGTVWAYAYFIRIRQLNGETLPIIPTPPLS